MPDLFLLYFYSSVWQQTRLVLRCCAFLVLLAWKLEKNSSLTSRLNWLGRLTLELFTPVFPELLYLPGFPDFLTSSHTWWTSLRNALVPRDFSSAKSRTVQMSYGAMWVCKNVEIISPDPHVLSSAAALRVCVCLWYFVCVKEWGRVKEWVFGTGRIWPCSSSPQSRELWLGQAKTVS